jgi:hypothetical protein
VGAGEVRLGVTASAVREVRGIEQELAAAQPRLGSRETKLQSVRKTFCIRGARLVNSTKQIKHTHLHATGLAGDFWPISIFGPYRFLAHIKHTRRSDMLEMIRQRQTVTAVMKTSSVVLFLLNCGTIINYV